MPNEPLTPSRCALGARTPGACNSPANMVLKPRKWQSAGSNVSFDKENELDTDAAALVHGDVLEPVAKPELGDVALKPLLIEVPNTPAQCDESVELELKAEAGADLGPVLTIAQFAPCPWVDFGRALVAKPTTATFTVHNPTGAVQTIAVVAESLGKGVAIESPEFPLKLEAHQSMVVVLAWTPKQEGPFATKLEFSWKGRRALALMARGDSYRAQVSDEPARAKRAAARLSAAPVLILEAKRPSDWGGNGARRKAEESAVTATPRAPPSRVAPLAFDRAADFANFDSFRAPEAAPPPSAGQGSASTSRRVSDAPSLASSTETSARIARATTSACVRQAEGAALRKMHEGSSTARKHAQAPSRAQASSTTLTLRKPATRAPPVEARKALYDVNWREKQERLYIRWINHSLARGAESSTPDGACARQLGAIVALEAWRAEAGVRRAALKLARHSPLARTLARIEASVAEGALRLRESPDLLADVGLRTNFCNMLACVNPLWLRPALEAVLGEMVLMPAGPLDSSALRRAVEQRVLGEHGAHTHVCMSAAEAKAATAAARAHTLRATVSLIVFLDAAKAAKLLGESDPCLFDASARIKSTKEMLQLFARDSVSAGGGDLARHVALLGHELKVTQTALDEFNFGVGNLAVDLRDGVRLAALIRRLALARAGATASAAAALDLAAELRVPAPSRLNKLHNVRVALSALAADGAPAAPLELEVRGVADGDCTVTLNVLWRIVAHFELPRLLPIAALRSELARLRADRSGARAPAAAVRSAPKAEEEDDFDELDGSLEYLVDDERLALLLQWVKAAVQPFGVPVRNLSTSFADGRVLCYAVHRYAPWLIGREAVRETVATLEAALAARESASERETLTSGRWVQTYDMGATDVDYKTARDGERANFKTLANAVRELGGAPSLISAADAVGTVPDEKMVVLTAAFLFARLRAVAADERAARTLQASVRARKDGTIRMTPDRARLADAVRARCATTLQCALRAASARHVRAARRSAAARTLVRALKNRLLVSRAKAELARARAAREAEILAAHARAVAAARAARHAAATRMQAAARGHLARLAAGEARELARARAEHAAACVQARARGSAARKGLAAARAAAVQLQAVSRRRRAMLELRAAKAAAARVQAAARAKAARAQLATARGAAVKLQTAQRARRARAVRATLSRLRDEARAAWAATVVQASARGRCARLALGRSRAAATTIAAAAKRRGAVADFKTTRLSIVQMQAVIRRHSAMRKLSAAKAAATWLQAAARRRIAWWSLEMARVSQIIIASAVRRHAAMVQLKASRAAAVQLQAASRRRRAMLELRAAKAAAARVQAAARATAAATRVQAAARAKAARAQLAAARGGAVKLQTAQRARHARATLSRLRDEARAVRASTVVQASARGLSARLALGRARAAATAIAAAAKRRHARLQLKAAHDAAIAVQAASRRRAAIRRLRAAEAATTRLREAAATRLQAAARRRIAWWSLEMARVSQIIIASAVRRHAAMVQLKASRAAAVQLQAASRRRRAMLELRAAKAAAARVQAAARAKAARTQLATARGAAIKVQAAQRAHRARAVRATLSRLRNEARAVWASTVVQAAARGLSARLALGRARAAATAITAAAKRRSVVVQRKAARDAAITLQAASRGLSARLAAATARAERARLAACARLHAQIAAATRLQAAARAALARVQLRAALRAVRVVQAVSRGRACRLLATTRAAAVVLVQARVRGALARLLAADERCAQRVCNALRVVQRGALCWRARRELHEHQRLLASVLLAGAARHRSLALDARRRKAATAIQAASRGMPARRERAAAMLAASEARAAESARAALHEAERILRDAAVCALSRRRAARKISDALFAFKHGTTSRALATAGLGWVRPQLADVAVARLQRAARLRAFALNRARFEASAAALIVRVARGALARARVRGFLRGITRLQALWRSRRVQRGAGRKLKLLRDALRAIAASASDRPTIGQATNSSLQVLLTSSNLGFVIKAVQLLDLSTSASVGCCEQLLVSGAIAVLVKLVRTCNRSAPHVQVATHAVSVLRNVCKYDYMMPAVFSAPEVVETLTELLTIHRERPEITTACLVSLRAFAARPEYARQMRTKKESVGRLQSLAIAIERKNHAPGATRSRVPLVHAASRSGFTPRTPTRRGPGVGGPLRSPGVIKRAAERSAHSETASLLHALMEALLQ